MIHSLCPAPVESFAHVPNVPNVFFPPLAVFVFRLLLFFLFKDIIKHHKIRNNVQVTRFEIINRYHSALATCSCTLEMALLFVLTTQLHWMGLNGSFYLYYYHQLRYYYNIKKTSNPHSLALRSSEKPSQKSGDLL